MLNHIEYLLGLAAEESCEVAQAASKCSRFTMGHSYDGKTTNIENLQTEITDLITVLTMLGEQAGVEFKLVPCEAKRARIEEYMKISRKMGQLEQLRWI